MSSPERRVAEAAQHAARRLATAPAEQREKAIRAAADLIDKNKNQLLQANAKDLDGAQAMLGGGEVGRATLERLRLSENKTVEMVEAMLSVAALRDPIGRVQLRTELDAGLVLERVSVPLGVLAIIFEARPDAVTQISALGLKSGNAVILKPGREVEHTAEALVDLIRRALGECGLPPDAVTLVKGREAVQSLLGMNDLIDMVIPRGSRELVEFVQRNTKIPVLGHAEGVCHIYVDGAANLEMALAIVDDAKTDYPAACNAAETVLVHQAVAASFLPLLAERLGRKNVRLRGCPRTRKVLEKEALEPVGDDEWHREYSGLVLAIRVVDSADAAIEHIQRYGSAHTEAIVTDDAEIAQRFLAELDSANVFHNASTRFADGHRYGFGAEVGISTSKLHARGPVGLEGLTTYKYVLRGSGQVAGDYRGPHARPFTHKPMPAE